MKQIKFVENGRERSNVLENNDNFKFMKNTESIHHQLLVLQRLILTVTKKD